MCTFDHGDQRLARSLYSEAQLLAASSGSIELQAHVWVNMSMQSTHLADAQGDPGLARAGLRFASLAADAARHEPSPRLHALIALREAAAHAQLGDAGAFQAAITQGRRELDRGPHPADPPWCGFVIEGQKLSDTRRMDSCALAALTGRSSSIIVCWTMTSSQPQPDLLGRRLCQRAAGGRRSRTSARPRPHHHARSCALAGPTRRCLTR
jgi:hypothetical protein